MKRSALEYETKGLVPLMVFISGKADLKHTDLCIWEKIETKNHIHGRFGKKTQPKMEWQDRFDANFG